MSVPLEVLRGTPKEATAYLHQIRALRNSSSEVRRSLDESLLKQAYSWDEFTSGLGNYSPLSYGLAGGGAGALIAAFNEQRKRKKHRNYSNVLMGGLLGGGLGAGGAYALGPKGLDVENLPAHISGEGVDTVAGTDPGEPALQDPGGYDQGLYDLNKPDSVGTIPGVETVLDADEPPVPQGSIDNTLITDIATGPGETVLEAAGVSPSVASQPIAGGAATTALLRGTTEGTAAAADHGADARAANRQTKADSAAVKSEVPQKVKDEVKALPPKGGPKARQQVVGKWIADPANEKQLKRLLAGKDVVINGKTFTKADLIKMMGDPTFEFKNVIQSPSRSSSLTGGLADVTPPKRFMDRARRILGSANTPAAVRQRINAAVAAGEITAEQGSIISRTLRSKAVRGLTYGPALIGVVAQVMSGLAPGSQGKY